MSKFLVKCALLAAAIAALAGVAGLAMYAVVILMGLGLVVFVLVSGGPPSDLSRRGDQGAFWLATDSYSSDPIGGGQSGNDCGSAGSCSDSGGGS